MSWFDNLKTPRIKSEVEQRISKVPEGLWRKCPGCGEILQAKVLKESLQVCPECSHHIRMNVMDRIAMLSDSASKVVSKTKKKKKKTIKVKKQTRFSKLAFKEYGNDLVSSDPLDFNDLKPYRDRLRASAEKTGINDAIVIGKSQLGGIPYHLGVFEFRFMGGSMGSVVGEKVTLLFEAALKDRLPAVIVSSSGGARMQEGIVSLMQMAKTTALVRQLRENGIPYISILTDPTTGGVAASFAMLGDLILAEPKALIGFAGPRVIEQTIRRSLPEGFQRSEFLLKRGFVDRIVNRNQLADELRTWMLWLGRENCRFPKGV